MANQTKSYTGVLNNHEFKKEGITNGRSWKKYLMTFEDGFKVTSFDQIHAGSIGKRITINVENRPWKGDDGVMRDSWTVVSARPAGRGVAESNNKFSEIMSTLAEIQAQQVGAEAKIDQILDDLVKRP